MKKIFDLDLNKKNVLITGCSGQLGSKIIEKFLKFGSNVIGIDTKNIKAKNYYFVKCDISNSAQVEKIFKKLNKKFGNFDILVNNAGSSIFTPFQNRKPSELDLVTKVNLYGTIYCTNNFIKYINKKNNNKIVNISSIYSLISPDPSIYGLGDRKNSEIYGATKAGINQLTKYYAIHLSKYNINVNCISPGGIFNDKKPQSKYFRNKYNKKNPLNRMATDEEISNFVIVLSSKMANYVNGHNLVIDGGMSVW